MRKPPTVAIGPEGLKLLLDYTKFHIGLYVTLFGASAAIVKGTPAESIRTTLHMFQIAGCGFILAGAAAGVIASSIPEYADSQAFQCIGLGPWWFGPFGFRYRVWAALEHTAFWVALIFLAVGLLFTDTAKTWPILDWLK